MPSNILLKVGSAPGTSGQKKGYMELTSWKWGMSLPAVPGSVMETHGRPAIDELVVTKVVDAASASLIKYLTDGSVFGLSDVELVMLANKGGSAVPFLTINFDRCVVARLQFEGGDLEAGDRVKEQVALRFGKFTLNYHGNETDIDAEYDIQENKPCG